MLNDELFDEIIDKAGINLNGSREDFVRIHAVVEGIYFEVELKYADGIGSATDGESRLLINEVVERLIVTLNKMFHERSSARGE